MNQGSEDNTVTGPGGRGPSARRTSIIAGILAAVAFLAFWFPTHEARPHLPTSDLYTHLTVARHLARGEGFKTDVTYPLSFAFPFARELPQPLIHRQPGFSLLLTLPYHAGSGYPGRVLDMVRVMQLVLLGMIVALGSYQAFRIDQKPALPVWLVLLFFNPLLVFAVDWGMVELACALLLLTLWLRARGAGSGLPDGMDGLMAGMLTLLRLDLVWVPILWWLFLRRNSLPPRRLGLVLLGFLLVITPWAVRNVILTGNPAFSLQTYAEHVKDTRAWPSYSVYRQLEPQPMMKTMTTDPVPVLRKAGRGMKFYYRHLPRLVPVPVLVGIAWGALAFLWSFFGRGSPGGKPSSKRGPGSGNGPTALTALTVILLSIQYSFFDHSLRHLLVVLPLVLWEFSIWISGAVSGYFSSANRRFGLPHSRWSPWVAASGLSLVVVFLFPCRLPGWESAAQEAELTAPQTMEAIDGIRHSKAEILFAARSAIPWFIDRPIVWNPEDEITRERIRALLEDSEMNREDTP